MIDEKTEQKKLVQWLRLNKYLFFAPSNENVHSFISPKISMILENKAKEMGKLKGVSDLVIFLDHKILFLELKRSPEVLKNGEKSISLAKVQDEQRLFLDNINAYDYCVGVVCYGFNDAVSSIKKFNKKEL